MGNYLSLKKAKFAIPITRTNEALAALVPLYRHVLSEEPATLSEVFGMFAWPLEKKGDHWVMVEGEAAKAGWQDELFEAVAPFVVGGSFVKADGEGGPYEWVFPDRARIVVGHAHIIVPVANLRDAFAAVEKKLPKLLANIDDPASVTAIFDRLGWKTSRMKDGSLQVAAKPGKEKEVTERDRRVLKVLAPFVAPESVVESSTGKWRMSFVGGRLEELRV